MTIRIVVADDHPIFREGLARSLSDSKAVAVVGQAADAPGAIELVLRTKPDVVLLDISMPGGGLTALREIASQMPETVVAMLTVSEEDTDIVEALKAGAKGYILKGIGARELLDVVTDLAAGRSYLSPSLAMKVLEAMRAPAEVPKESPLDTLTPREEDILRLVSEGLSNKEVARRLDLQEKTVKHYMTSILQKLHARNRVEAALIARDHWRG
ncbi:response regulator transcription factor [Salipiger bermudensis]|uniref:response regulator n=1 Tax=Salipiger bermudensis TaxID=344736 RepID=UPI001C998E83|nr:response regulator transcription factor [Salipiger bermudensis]MBY6004916.1 response regulator transcription factor [Salipiger bermudensis]